MIDFKDFLNPTQLETWEWEKQHAPKDERHYLLVGIMDLCRQKVEELRREEKKVFQYAKELQEKENLRLTQVSDLRERAEKAERQLAVAREALEHSVKHCGQICRCKINDPKATCCGFIAKEALAQIRGKE